MPLIAKGPMGLGSNLALAPMVTGALLFSFLSLIVSLNVPCAAPWAFTAAYFWLTAGFFLLYLRRSSFDLLSPAAGLSVLIFLYSMATVLFVDTLGVTYFGESVPQGVMPKYYIACYAGTLGLYWGILSAGRRYGLSHIHRRPLSAKRVQDDRIFRKIVYGSAAFVALTLSLFFYERFNPFSVQSYADQAFQVRLERMDSTVSGLKDVFLVELPSTLILIAAVLLFFRSKNILVRIFGLLIFADYMLVNTLAGWRQTVVAAILIAVVYLHYEVRKLRLREGVLLGVLLYLFVNGLSIARSSSNLVEMITLVSDAVSEQGAGQILSLAQSGELVTSSNLVRLIMGIEAGETIYNYGGGWLDELMVFVPRAFLEQRPLPMSEKFVEQFYPGVRDAGGGYGFFIFQEGYWAFGIVGVFVSMVIYGYLVERIYQKLIGGHRSDFSTFAYALSYGALVMAAVRSGALSSFKAALINIIPLVFVFIIALIIHFLLHIDSGKLGVGQNR